MSLLDELKKWTHPYEDEDEEYDDFEEPVRQNAFEDRKLKVEDRRNKVVNIHATTQLKSGAGEAGAVRETPPRSRTT